MLSYPKGNRSTPFRSSRPRKRRFHENQFTNKINDPIGESTSAKKLTSVSSEDVHQNSLHSYRIIEFFTAVSEFVICRKCKQNLKFEEAENRGLCSKLVLLCRCGRRDINSGPFINTGQEVNRRIVFIMRLLGIGKEGLNTFCNFMDICNGLTESAYNKIVEHSYTVTRRIRIMCTESCK